MIQTELPAMSRLKKLEVGMRVEIIGPIDDHECAYTGQRGEIIARHDAPRKVQYLVALTCGHRCRWFFTRDQLCLVTDSRPYSAKN